VKVNFAGTVIMFDGKILGFDMLGALGTGHITIFG
jgi:hypothetical protein